VTEDAFGAVVAALARRDLTAVELDERLARAGFDAATRADALARAVAAGYLDDARAAVEHARRLADRDASDAAIRLDLRRRGVSDDVAEAALADLSPEADRAARLARRLGGGARAARGLGRKGFSDEVVRQALRLPIAD
jgi:regulatory protein